MTIIAVSNQKGGVGKSTTAHAIGSGLARRGYRVLFVDLDSQGNLSYAMHADGSKEWTSYHVLANECQAAQAIQKTKGGDLIASSPALAGADLAFKKPGKEYRLIKALWPLRSSYHFAVIDTPPALGALTVNALAAAEHIIIPAQADIFSLQGIGQLYNTIDAVRTHCNPNLTVAGILLTRFNPRSVLTRDVTDMITDTARTIGTSVFRTVIREGVAVREAQASQSDLFSYAAKSNSAQDYDAFVEEYLAKYPHDGSLW